MVNRFSAAAAAREGGFSNPENPYDRMYDIWEDNGKIKARIPGTVNEQGVVVGYTDVEYDSRAEAEQAVAAAREKVENAGKPRERALGEGA